MKTKITYLLFLLPLMTFAQGSWEFNTASDTEGWSVGQGSAVPPASGPLSATGTAIEYTTITGNSATSRNPTFTKTSASIDAITNNQIEVSVKNGSGATYLRLSATIGTATTIYNNLITAGDTGYKIYTFTLTSTGTITALSLEFRLSDGTASGSTNYVPQATPSTVGTIISIDYIRPKIFVAPIQNTFNFDSTTEGYTSSTRLGTPSQTTDLSKGVLMVTPTGSSSSRGIIALSASFARVDATNKYAHITLKNTSSFDKIELGVTKGSAPTYIAANQTLKSGDTNYTTYDFDLKTWDVVSQFPTIAFSREDTWVSGKTYTIDNTVVVKQSFFKNIGSSNITGSPTTNTADWVISDATGVPQASTWVSGSTYATDTNVILNGAYYFYKASTSGNSTGDPSTDTTKWTPGLAYGNAITALPIYIDSIVFDNVAPIIPEVNVFNFETTTEGFTTLTRASAVPAIESGNGTLQVKYVSGTNNALAAVVGLNSSIARVEGTNQYAHITLKNKTTNNQFQLKGKVGTATTAFSPIQTYTTSDAGYTTYDFDLITWDSGDQFPELNFAVKNTWLATSTYVIGDIVISGNTYCKNKTGINSTGLGTPANVPHTDTANWDIVNAAGAVADATPATNGAILGGALDLTNSVYIDSIVFDNVAPIIPEVNVFNFDTTAEGFTTLTRATAVQATESLKGTLKINATTAAATNAKVALSSFIAHVEGANKYAHITLKNTSTTNTLFQLNGKVDNVGTAFSPIQTYTISDADYKTYDFDLSTWDSGDQFPELIFGVKDTWSATPAVPYAAGDIVIVSNTYYKSLTGDNTAVDAAALKLDATNWVIVNAAGAVADATPATNGAILGGALDLTNSVYIDSIVFDNTDPTLGTSDFGYANNTISLYPNPAQEVLNISSAPSITKIQVYDLLGKKVASNNNAKNVNVAALGKGIYVVKVAQENGSVVAKRFVKQ